MFTTKFTEPLHHQQSASLSEHEHHLLSVHRGSRCRRRRLHSEAVTGLFLPPQPQLPSAVFHVERGQAAPHAARPEAPHAGDLLQRRQDVLPIGRPSLALLAGDGAGLAAAGAALVRRRRVDRRLALKRRG